MSDIKRLVLILFGWTSLVTALHLGLNVDWSVVLNDRMPEDKRKLYVAYIPVT
ncbi:MAG: hypothetical protein IPM24_07975 [Bryobacterales bacterium]|nr:hypothetical protein [Bryobacterales bacterium]